MKNNKGMTLVELIVSIALISMVMVFLTKLLVDVSSNSVNVITKGEYQEAVTILTKNIQDAFLKEEINYIRDCDATDQCYEVLFLSSNYLQVSIANDKKSISIIKKDKDENILYQEIKQTPVKTNDEYVGSYDNLGYTTNVLSETSSSYSYKYDSLLKLNFSIFDKQNNEYKVETFYPYEGGFDFTTPTLRVTLMILTDGGTWNGVSPQEVRGSSVLDIPEPTKEGYAFLRWDVAGENASINGSTLTVGSTDTTLTAVWI